METVFPGKLLILVVTTSFRVFLTPPVVLNLSVHLSSVPTFLGALGLAAVFRKKTVVQAQTSLANTCVWLIYCLFFRQHCWFKCRCLPLFYSLIAIYFLN